MDFKKLFGLPEVASAHGQQIDFMIYVVHWGMFALCLGWGLFYFVCLFRFNRFVHPRALYEGTKSHISQWLEVAVIIFEAILLVGLSIPFWDKQVNAMPDRKDSLEIRINAEQFAWNIHYPGPDGIFGNTSVKYFDKQNNPMGLDPTDPNGKDDFTTINQLHLPVGRPVIIYLTSRDVMHSFTLTEMRVKQDIIPGMSIPTWFIPTKTGHYEIACAQLCGLGHYRMKGFVTVHSQEEYDAWVKTQSATQAEQSTDADSFWN